MTASSVLVAGSLHHDVIVRAERLPALDETLPGSSVAYIFGGKGGNQALAAARHGAATAMAGRVGRDAAGAFMLEELDRAGVDRSMVRVDEAASTGMSVAIVAADGDYGAVIVSGANLAIAAEEIEIPATARVVLLQNEILEPANVEIAAKARAAGALTVLNAAPARPPNSDLFAAVDLLVVNRVEAAALAGLPVESPEDAAQAAWLLAGASRAAIVTLGADGAVLSENSGAPRHFPAPPVEVVVSTHGAGDAFAGALAARLASGSPLDAAITYAQAAAALHVSRDAEGQRRITPAEVFALLGEA